jgi:hypothetical protein
MAERPIIFSGDMVRAILDGRKTQTRRILRPQPPANAPNRIAFGPDLDDGIWGFWDDEGREYRAAYQPGDILWVRETWHTEQKWDDVEPNGLPWDVAIQYESVAGPTLKEGLPSDRVCAGRWRSPIHMPRWAARLLLEIVAVRAERLQEISEADAIAEGMGSGGPVIKSEQFGAYMPHARYSYALLWDRLNAERGHPWAANEWVGVYTFKRKEAADGA